jgi:hypothetical protein
MVAEVTYHDGGHRWTFSNRENQQLNRKSMRWRESNYGAHLHELASWWSDQLQEGQLLGSTKN